ncbi:bifunctional DNA-binding transcriptional regulator/O6-methylguanine-DNA methyltransferase Ada [Brucella abortus]|uniref:bifunctional DNA-binding transcriptional regulator/O6-methylguanine-DNA methyltransferase Ada n=1 Tax=Brucella abortus TaxID=235 RepID=UPI0012DF3A6D|nr:bifunctional DNA-binding transcriptional regulator/O6-methylguanine-DNA methyltransferase Ada [Brucella abortus]MBJ8120632.1 bifunctional DNA-binding transcriptional regulator/O6-methylguanine-DNA methyltransferase Ada [Brucella abortus]MUJ76615.1 bifunctional DNA-binding transcriptional regulator/O6-methylguanine-DNA methyltransferase Ada [Brucella abortus]
MNLMIPKTHDPDESRWQKVLDRDKASDGKFVYAVRTTGVYCRPSCPSRRGKRENVQFFNGCEDAERAGFRPCLRCKPDLSDTLATQNNARHAEMVASACRFIETAETQPSLEEIANVVKASPAHFHRVFKAFTGLTPKAHADAHRAGRMRVALDMPQIRVTDTIYDAGYNSSSRFYEASDRILGMTPKAYRAGGKDADIRFAIGQSTLGAVLVAASGKSVCAIFMGDDPQGLIHDLEKRFPKANLIGADRNFENLVAEVVGFVEAPGIGLDLPLDLRGTAFQQRVWRALCEIPAGETVSYTDIAERISAPRAVRAVAQACAANKIAVAVPCHRVVRNDGGISGYRWGVERKRDLLERERKA